MGSVYRRGTGLVKDLDGEFGGVAGEWWRGAALEVLGEGFSRGFWVCVLDHCGIEHGNGRIFFVKWRQE